jgi:AhpD family alkylhydroperoxidase
MPEQVNEEAKAESEVGSNNETRNRASWAKVSLGALVAMRVLSDAVAHSGLDRSLLNLVDIRVSQINGCAECIDIHTKDARLAGETEQRIYELSAWRDAPFYSDKERAALAWAEAVTFVSETRVPDKVYQEARKHFSEKDLVNLTLAVVAINGWNRFNISFRIMPSSYVPQEIKVIRGRDSLS